MKEDEAREVDMVGWVARALEARAAKKKNGAAVSTSGPEIAEGHAEDSAKGSSATASTAQPASAGPSQQ
jgi:hypothetical protein